MKKLVIFISIVYGLSGCAVNKTKLLDFPNTRQSFEYSCGPGAVQAVMAYYGQDFRESELIDLLKTDKTEGTYVKDIIEFNITPSPGASTCLGNAFEDTSKLMEFLSDRFTFDRIQFEKDLVEKELALTVNK